MDILKTHVEEQRDPGARSSRRALEQQVRGRALDVADDLAAFGYSLAEAAQQLGLPVRTLRHWDIVYRRRADAPALLGRPRADAGPAQQQAVLDYLGRVGPGVGVPTLRVEFPSVSRVELDELLQCYRALWRAQHTRAPHVLHWRRPGTVWAMDFAEPPAPIDGIYPYLLAVRDLASGQQLLWQPVRADTAEVVCAELVPLFVIHGAPWVLKSDNGSAFRAAATQQLLARWQVFSLFSPPRTPSYNGSIEAAIGSLKTRTERRALAAGHPGVWTGALVEFARQEANATARPRRLHGATPAEVWAGRLPWSAVECQQFRATVAAYQSEGWQEQGGRPEEEVSHWQEAAMNRIALRRALVAHDLLLFRRRRIPARITRPKAANNG